MSVTEMKNIIIENYGFENKATIDFFRTCEKSGYDYNAILKKFDKLTKRGLEVLL
jgi:hypothetical protein